MAKKKSSFLKNILQLSAWILLLSAYGVTLHDLVMFTWFDTASELFINFFTW